MTAESRSVVVRLSMEAADYIRTAQQAGALGEEAMTRIERGTKKSTAAVEQLGRTSGQVALLAVAGLGTMIGAAARFDHAMSGVQAATHETASNMGLLRQAALDAGRVTVFSASESADAIEQLAKAGVSTADILAGGLRGSLNLAAAGSVAVGDAAEYMATALTQFQLPGKQASHVADLLAAGANKAQGEVSDMAVALDYAGIPAHQLGISIEQTAGTIALFAKNGLIGEKAGTSLRGMLSAIVSPSTQAAKEMDRLGISVFDAQGNFIGMDGVAQVFQDRLGGLTQQERNYALGRIFGNQQLQAAGILYQEGAAGVQKWTKAVDDQGYAAKTASIRMDNLLGDLEQLRGSLETAFIGAGESDQGSLRTLTQGVTAAVNAFNKAPHAVQSTATSLLAITAVTSSGLWLGATVITKIQTTRAALAALSETSTVGATSLKALGYAGLALAGWSVAVLGVKALQSAVLETLPGVNALEGQLLALQSGEVSNIGSQFDDLGSSIDRIANKGNIDKIADAVNTVVFFGAKASDLQNATNEVSALDNALAGLVSSGQAAQASAAFDKLTTSAGLTDDQITDLKKLLPNYQDALAGASNQADQTASAYDKYSRSTYKAADGTEVTAAALKRIKKAYADARKDATETAASFIDISKNADKAKVSLQQWLHQMEQQTKALEDFTANTIKAGNKGVKQGLIDELEQLGPVGALRMRQLANATHDEIARANRDWAAGQKAIEDYTDATVKVPRELKTHVTVEDAEALDRVRTLGLTLSGLHDKTIYITTVLRSVHEGNRLTSGQSGGGGGSSGSSRLAAGDPRRDASAPTLREIFNALLSDAVGNLTGGIHGGKKVQAALGDFNPNLGQGVDGVRQEIEDLRRALHDAGHKWTKAMQDQADALIEVAREHDIAKALKKFDIDVKDGTSGVRAELKDLRQSIRDAGGTWSDEMAKKGHRLVQIANAYDLAAVALDKSQSDLQAILDQQAAYAEQVGGVFNTNPFGNGLAGLDRTVAGNTGQTQTFDDVLQQLAAQGLDGDLFKQLAASGDLQTAIQLLATGPAGIQLREDAFAAMLQAQQQLGTFAGGQVFGGQVSAGQAAEAAAQARVDALVQAGERQQKKIDHLIVKLDNLPHGVLTANREGSYQGTKEGIQAVSSAAGRQISRGF